MKGIQFLVDENNEKVAVQIDLNIYGELWEDIYDAILAEQSKGEETISFDDYISELKEDGVLNEDEVEYIYATDAKIEQ